MTVEESNAATLLQTAPFDGTLRSVEAIRAFVEQLAREYFMDSPDRRSEPRYRITLPVILEPVNADRRPTGLRLRAVTRDISESGIGLISQDPVSGEVKVEVNSPSGNSLTVIAEVNRCESVGYYFNVGCNILTDD